MANDMEGRVLEGALTPELMARHPVRWVATHESVDRGRVIQQTAADAPVEELRRGLEVLGYVEPAPGPDTPPSSPEIHNALARSHLFKGDVAAAREEVRRSLAADPHNADALAEARLCRCLGGLAE